MSRDAKEVNENYSWRVIVVTIICLATSAGIVGLRLYVRRFLIRNLGVDDWFLVASLVLYIACAIITSVSKRALPVQLNPSLIGYEAIKFGLSRHDSTVSFPEKIEFLKLMWIASIGYGGVIVLLKATFLLQYRRAFPLRYIQLICNAFLVFIAMWAIGGTIGALLNCQPIEQNWDPLLYKSCRERYNFWFAMGILHVLTDAVIFTLPLPALNTLSLPTLQKGVLIGIFSLGFFTCAISIIRLTTLRASTQGDDLTWTMQNTVIWSVAEVACAIICACIPTLRPLLPRFTGWQQYSYHINQLLLTPRLEESNMCHRGALQ